MSMLTLVPLFVLVFIGNTPFKGVSVHRTILNMVMEPCNSNDRIFTGYIVGEIGMLYRNAITENLTTEVNLQLQAGNCDVATTVFQHATVKTIRRGFLISSTWWRSD